MNDRRSFFKSLAILGAAAAGCPGIFIPKLEPVRWKADRLHPSWGGTRSYYGRWTFVIYEDQWGNRLPAEAAMAALAEPKVSLIKPCGSEWTEVVFHKREVSI